MRTIYKPSEYYRRALDSLQRVPQDVPEAHQYHGLKAVKALLRIVFELGVLDAERREFWRFFLGAARTHHDRVASARQATSLPQAERIVRRYVAFPPGPSPDRRCVETCGNKHAPGPCDRSRHRRECVGHFVWDETAYLLLDIGFIWNIYLDGEMGLVPQTLAMTELRSEIGEDFESPRLEPSPSPRRSSRPTFRNG